MTEIPPLEEMSTTPSPPKGLVNTQAVGVAGAVMLFSQAVVAALLGFGVVDWTPDQERLFQAVVTAGIILAGTIWARSKVWSKASVAKIDPAALVQ